jgi:hypothetical protein
MRIRTVVGGSAGLIEVVKIQSGGKREITMVNVVCLMSQFEHVSAFLHEQRVG